MRKERESILKDEQQRLLSVPRKFKKSDKLNALWAVQLLVVPHALIGPAIIATSIFAATVLLAGRTVSGTISEMRTSTDSDDGRVYQIKYDYEFNNQTYHGSGVTDKSTYKRLKPGDHVSAKVLPPLPNFGTQLLDGNAPWAGILFMFGFGAVWTALMAVLLKHLFIDPRRRTSVMTTGKMCLGKITDKSISGEDDDIYTLRYQYEPLPGKYKTGKDFVAKASFDRAKIGEDVTVLYDPKRLSNCLIYRYSDYELIS